MEQGLTALKLYFEHYRKVWLISACAYFVSGKKLCAYYMYALITRICAYYAYAKPVYDVYRDQRSLNTTGQQCMHFSQHQSSTDLQAVACNLGKLNAGAKNRASHYTARLSADTVDYLCSYLLKCCSVPYATERSITLFCTHATRVYTRA